MGELIVDGFEVIVNYNFIDNIVGCFVYIVLDGIYDIVFVFNNVGDDLEIVLLDIVIVGLGYVFDEGDWGVEFVVILSKGVEESI